MQSAPRAGDLSLQWELGFSDSRYDHSLEKKVLPGAFALVYAMVGLFAFVFAPPFLAGWTRTLIAVLAGFGIITLILGLTFLLTWNRYAFQVKTYASVPPGRVIEVLDELIPDRVKSYERIKRTPGLHEELVRYEVMADWEVEALVIIGFKGWYDKDKTEVEVRSSENRDDWVDLRSTIEEAIDGAS